MNPTKLAIFYLLFTMLSALCAALPISPLAPLQFTPAPQGRPDSCEFNPMHLGDKWWWEYDYYVPYETDYFTREITDSTVISGITYYRIRGMCAAYAYNWVRNDADSIMLFDINNLDSDSTTTELKAEDFTIIGSIDDPGWVYQLEYSRLSACYLVNEGNLTGFWGERFAKEYHYWDPEITDSHHDYIWVDGLGPMAEFCEWYTAFVTGCRINGVVYGDTTVAITDQTAPRPSHVQCRNYPNPFNGETTIAYQLPSGATSGTIEFFDIRGRRLRTAHVLANNGKYVWDCRDGAGNPVASGVYLCRVGCSREIGQTIKMLYLK